MPPNLSSGLVAELARLSKRIAGIEAGVAQLKRNQRAASLGNASVDNGSFTVNNANGDPVLVMGLQDDGSFAVSAVGADVPIAPSVPQLVPGIVEIQATWDGNTLTGTTPPADFAAIQVHVSPNSGFTPDNTTLQGTLVTPGTFRIGGSLNPGQVYYVVFVQVNVHGNLSAPSIQASAIPLSPAAGIGPGQLTAQQLGLPGGVLNPNPYFLGGYGGDYTAVNGLFSVVAAGSGLAAGVPYGYGGQYVNNGLANGYLQENGGQFPVTAGAAYLITCWAYSSDGQVNLGIAWTGGTAAGTISTQTIPVPVNVFTQVQAVITAPPSGTGVTGGYAIAGLPGNDGGTLQVCALLALQSLPGGLVQAGTVTAAQIAAGIVVAGIINGTVVNAATFNGSTFNGTNWIENAQGSYFYGATPAANNLTASILQAAGTDSKGNVTLAGITSYQDMTGLQPGGGFAAFNLWGNSLAVYSASTETGGGWANQGGITWSQVAGRTSNPAIVVQSSSGNDLLLRAVGNNITIWPNGTIELLTNTTYFSQASAPGSTVSGARMYADVNGFLRVIDVDAQTYAIGHALVQNTAGSTINTGGAYGTVATVNVGVGTYRIRGQISYSTTVGSPTGQPRVRFDIGTATQGHTRGSYWNAAVPQVIDKGLTSSDTFAGNNLTASAQLIEFDFVMPFTASGTFLVSMATTGSSYTANFVNLHVDPL